MKIQICLMIKVALGKSMYSKDNSSKKQNKVSRAVLQRQLILSLVSSRIGANICIMPSDASFH